MEYWMTQDGVYYEADGRINSSDVSVPRRPNDGYVFHNGQWCDGIPHEEPQHIHKVKLHPNAIHCGQQYPHHARQSLYPPYEPFYPQKEPVHHVEEAPKKSEGVVLSESTKVMFGVRELVMIAAFVVTATVSWQDTNSRIMKLEDSKHVEEINGKIKNIEMELKALDKQSRSDTQKLEQTIREIEQVIFMRNHQKNK